MFKKSFLKNTVLSLLVIVSCFFSMTLDASAVTQKSGYVDNDTNVSGYSNNSSTGTHCDDWGVYLYSGNYGDSRYRQSTTRKYYEWVWGHIVNTSSPVTWKAKVYLNNYSFTDPSAEYTVMRNSSQMIAFCNFNINQNIAPSGYSVFSGIESFLYISGGTFHPWYAHVRNSGISGVGTGADTFYYEFSY